jgi:hypothetical protein
MTAAAATMGREKSRSSWSVRLLAVLGFLLLGAVGAVFASQQMAVDKARGYLKGRFKTNIEVPVKSIRPDFVFEPTSGRAAPPLGFCWTIEIDTGVGSGEVMVNPWNHEVVDWNVSEL